MSVEDKASAVVGHVSRQVIEGFETKVEAWMSGHIPGFAGTRIKSLHSSSSGGLSGETHIISLAGQSAPDSQLRTIVLKKDVGDKKTNPQTNFENLVKVQMVLGDIPGFPIPRVLGSESSANILGAPFLVMEFVEGDIPADVPSYAASGWVRDATDEQRSKLWRSGIDFLVQLHRLDWRQHGLGQLRFEAAGADDLERCLNYAIDKFRNEAEGETTPLCERAISWLQANRPQPGTECICWGDARIGNIIWRNFECAAVIDWEMCSLGCPAIDVGYWSFFHRWSTFGQGLPALGGMCVGQELADLYEECGGGRIENFLYYEILATVRGLSIWLRMYKLMRADGKLPPTDPLDDSIHMVRVLRVLMDQTT